MKSAVTKPLLVIVLLIPFTALALLAEGRLFSCACGEFEFWVGDTCSSQNSQQLFDPYSLTHILHGILILWLLALIVRKLSPAWQRTLSPRGQRSFSLDWQLALGAILEALWEALENTNFVIDRYRAQTAALGYTGDTVINAIGDFVCAIIGFVIARRLGWFRSLIGFLLLELLLLLWIRDSLLLQILMLIYPVNALKAWQMCP